MVVLIWIFAASGLYLGILFFVQYFYLKNSFFYGDAFGYHQNAISVIRDFKQGRFLITSKMIGNGGGYAAYFVAPIYLVGGNIPIMPKLVQALLCLHIAIRIYDLTFLALDDKRPAKMAFFFAIFFAEMIILAQYLLKDLLALWCVVNLLYYAALLRKSELGVKNLVCFSLFGLYLYSLRISLLAIVVAGCAFHIIGFFRLRYRVLATILLILVIFFKLKPVLSQQVVEAESLFLLAPHAKTVFPGASSLGDIVSVTVKNPLPLIFYFTKVFSGVFAVGLAAIRDLFSGNYIRDYGFGIVVAGFGAIWRFINLPISLFGLYIILKKHRSVFSHILSFSLALMLIMTIIGYNTRWGLPSMILCSICWGVGFHPLGVIIFKKSKLQPKELSAAHSGRVTGDG